MGCKIKAMPSQARLDAPGAFSRVLRDDGRGIERMSRMTRMTFEEKAMTSISERRGDLMWLGSLAGMKRG
jgi:hypothetical protein